MKKLNLIAVLSLISTSLLAQHNYDGQSVIYSNNQNVGIGISNPASKLHVQNGSTSYLWAPRQGTVGIFESADANRAFLTIAGRSSAQSELWFADENHQDVGRVRYDHRNDGLEFWTLGNPKMTITNDGRVGIGMSYPVAKLHVQNGSTSYSWAPLQGTVGIFESADANRAFLTIAGKSTAQSELWFADENHQNSGRLRYDHSIDALELWTSGYSRMTLTNDGKVGIGTQNPDEQLTVNGSIHAREVKVDLNIPAPDYVFEPGYDLLTIKEVKEFILEHSHLPEIPSAKEMESDGIDLGDMNMRLLKKIEELTLYQIELLERLEKAEKKIQQLEEK